MKMSFEKLLTYQVGKIPKEYRPEFYREGKYFVIDWGIYQDRFFEGNGGTRISAQSIDELLAKIQCTCSQADKADDPVLRCLASACLALVTQLKNSLTEKFTSEIVAREALVLGTYFERFSIRHREPLAVTGVKNRRNLKANDAKRSKLANAKKDKLAKLVQVEIDEQVARGKKPNYERAVKFVASSWIDEKGQKGIDPKTVKKYVPNIWSKRVRRKK